MIQEISREKRKAAKQHQCFHCYKPIVKGELHEVFTGKNDYIYTIRSHLDCQEMSYKLCSIVGWSDYWDGIPPLLDEIQDSGDFERECNYWRGYFPHVVTRLEYHDQKYEGLYS